MIRDKAFYRTLLAIALPVAFQNMIGFGVNMLDTVMVSQLGDVPVSAASLANQVSAYMMFMVRGLSGGTAMMISQYWGKGDMPRIKTIMGIGLKAALGISALVTALVAAFPTVAMGIFTNDPQIIAQGAVYLRWVCWSYILFAVSETFVNMLRCVQIVRVGLVVACISFFVNLGGNYVLIFGKLGLPAMGIRGAGLATVIARAVELGVVILYVALFDTRLRLRVRELLAHNGLLWRDFLRYGTPIAGGDMLWGLVGLGKATIIGRLGAAAVAANSITEVTLQLSTVFIFGLASAACILVGKTVGARQYDLTRAYSRTLQILFFGVGFVVAAGTYLLRPAVISLYNVSPEAKELALRFLIYGAITIWGTAYAAACFVGINRGAGDANFVVKTDLICGWLIVLPLAALGAFVWRVSAPVVFFFTRIDQIIKVFIAYIRLNTSDRWIHNVTRD